MSVGLSSPLRTITIGIDIPTYTQTYTCIYVHGHTYTTEGSQIYEEQKLYRSHFEPLSFRQYKREVGDPSILYVESGQIQKFRTPSLRFYVSVKSFINIVYRWKDIHLIPLPCTGHQYLRTHHKGWTCRQYESLIKQGTTSLRETRVSNNLGPKSPQFRHLVDDRKIL